MVDVETVGPTVGQVLLDFSLPDQHGQALVEVSPRTKRRGHRIRPLGRLVPYCKTQLVEQQSRLADIRKAGMGLAAISYDPA